MSWEESVQWLRNQPDQQELVRACYFDDPLLESAERFWQSVEWKSIAELLPIPKSKGNALDLAAGRGISSYALARDGWTVTALEPDPGELVGSGAIRSLIKQSNLPISIVSEYSENLPFEDNNFDVVNCRQALHHAKDLGKTCREIYRVLKPGGLMIATREHVISEPEDLPAFLDSHPLHKYYGGENAYLLEEYLSAIAMSGLNITRTMAPLDSPINYFPMTDEQMYDYCTGSVAKIFGEMITQKIFSSSHFIGRFLMSWRVARMNLHDHTPGRLYSFLAEKPIAATN